MLPVTHVLAFGECQGCGDSQRVTGGVQTFHGDVTQLLVLQALGWWHRVRLHQVSILRRWMGRLDTLLGPPISQGSSTAPWNKAHPYVETGPGGSPGLTAELGAPCLSGSISLPVQVPPQSPSSRSHLG